MEKYEELKTDITKEGEKITEITKSQQYLGVLVLYYYLLALQKAKKIRSYDWGQNNAFFRYGRVANYFQFAERALSIPSGMSRELFALQRREKGLKSVKKAVSSKGGKSRVEKYDDLKTKIFALLEEKHSKVSNRQAAIRICKTLKGDPLMSLITAEYPEETVAKWIGKYKKEKAKL